MPRVRRIGLLRAWQAESRGAANVIPRPSASMARSSATAACAADGSSASTASRRADAACAADRPSASTASRRADAASAADRPSASVASTSMHAASAAPDGSAFCEHNKRKYRCRTCRGSSAAPPQDATAAAPFASATVCPVATPLRLSPTTATGGRRLMSPSRKPNYATNMRCLDMY